MNRDWQKLKVFFKWLTWIADSPSSNMCESDMVLPYILYLLIHISYLFLVVKIIIFNLKIYITIHGNSDYTFLSCSQWGGPWNRSCACGLLSTHLSIQPIHQKWLVGTYSYYTSGIVWEWCPSFLNFDTVYHICML